MHSYKTGVDDFSAKAFGEALHVMWTELDQAEIERRIRRFTFVPHVRARVARALWRTLGLEVP